MKNIFLILAVFYSSVASSAYIDPPYPIAYGGTGKTTAQTAIDALLPPGTAGQYCRSNGSHDVMANIQAADVPTLNQNTTGSAGSLSATLAAASGGTGQTSVASAFVSFYESVATTLGDLIYGGASGTPTRLGIGTTGQVLTVVAGTPAWATSSGGGASTALDNLGSTAINTDLLPGTSGSINVGNTSFAFASMDTEALVLQNSDNTTVTLACPASAAGYTLTFPLAAPTAGQYQEFDDTGQAVWINDVISAQALTGTITVFLNWAAVKQTGLFTKTLSANTTFIFTGAVTGQTIKVRLTNTASNYTVTWPTTNVKWAGGSAPTETIGAKSDIIEFTYDGTTYFGSTKQNY